MDNPSWLWGLLPVAAVAAWSLFRPARQLVTVASLELWQEAVDRLDRSQRSRSRRITLAWILLLAGALSAVTAAARPAVLSSAPARSVAVAIYPSSEVATEEGMRGLRQAEEALLARLGPGDRVQLLLPHGARDSTRAGGSPAAATWVSVHAARSQLADVRPLPVRASDLSLPAADKEAQHVYRIAPAGAMIPPVAGQTLIEAPTALPDVTVDALAAATMPLGGPSPQADGNLQVFLALHDWTGRPWQGRWRLTAWDANGIATTQSGQTPPLAAGERGAVVVAAPPAPYLAAEARGGEGSQPSYAFLARRQAVRAKVALLGGDDPLIRRFVRISPELVLVSSPAEADVLVCIGQEPPVGAAPRGASRPALVVHPPTPPPGARAEPALENLVLREAGGAADTQDPVMRDVDASAVAIRRVEPWRLDAGGKPERGVGLKALCSVKGAALIARTAPELGGDPDAPKRVYLAFGLDTENTNFAATESFVIFLANAFRWLAPRRLGEARYEFLSPSQAPARDDWTPAETSPAASPGGPGARSDAKPGEPAWAKGPFLPPGVYRDSQGDFHAVSLAGLRAARPAIPPAAAVAAAPLPDPRPTGTTRELWPWLALAAIALWLGGWTARAR